MADRTFKEKRLYVRFDDLEVPTTTNGSEPIPNVININDDANPVIVNNEHFTGHLTVRCKNFSGWTPINPDTGLPEVQIPTTEYFAGHRRLFSFQMTGRFKKAWNGDEIVFGCFFKKPIVLPRGHQIAMSIAKKIDRSLVFDVDRPDPAMYSPLISTMTTFSFQRCTASNTPGSKERPLSLPCWTYSGADPKLKENIIKDYEQWHTQPLDSAMHYENCTESLENLRQSVSECCSYWGNTFETCRKKWFNDPVKRRHFIFHPQLVYSFDMATPFLDLNSMKLKLGLSFDIEPYLGGQPLRYECRTRDGSIIFWSAEAGRK